MLTPVIALIETVYTFLWGDLITLPLPGGGTLGLPLLVLLLIPTGLYFTFRTRFLPLRLFPDMIRATLEKRSHKTAGCPPCRHSLFPLPPEWAWAILWV